MFFHTKRLRIQVIKLVEDTSNKTDSSIILHQNPFIEDQPVLIQPSQAIFVPIAPYDNIEDNNNNDHESNIDVLEEICSHSD